MCMSERVCECVSESERERGGAGKERGREGGSVRERVSEKGGKRAHT